MKIRKNLSVLLSILMICLLCSCNSEYDEKSIVRSSSLRVIYEFEEACDLAHSIVIAEVTAVPEARVEESIRPDGKVMYLDAFTDIELKIEKTLKGEQKKTTVFHQEGGETKDRIYIVDGIEILKEGDRVLLFLRESGHAVSPTYVLRIDSDNNITPSYFPTNSVWTASSAGKINVYDYAELITNYIEK